MKIGLKGTETRQVRCRPFAAIFNPRRRRKKTSGTRVSVQLKQKQIARNCYRIIRKLKCQRPFGKLGALSLFALSVILVVILVVILFHAFFTVTPVHEFLFVSPSHTKVGYYMFFIVAKNGHIFFGNDETHLPSHN